MVVLLLQHSMEPKNNILEVKENQVTESQSMIIA